MREISFYNMVFGDSFLIKDDKSGLLVDCGSYSDPLNVLYLTTHQINNDLNTVFQKDLLITHYHMDHFNNLLNLGTKFDTIYVRNLGSSTLSFTYASMFVELVKYAKRSGDYKTFVAWLSRGVLYSLLAKGGVVRGLNCDNNKCNTFKIGASTAKVLWPTTNLRASTLKSMEKHAKYIESIIEENLTDDIKHYLSDTKMFWEKVFSLVNENVTEPNLWDEIRNMSLDSYELSLEKATLLVDIIEPLIKNIKKELLDLENYLSIVFEIDGKLLMCGDADASSMMEAIKNSDYYSDDTHAYKIIKVQHHGTSAHYYKTHYNEFTEWLIPNSCKIQRPSWSIDPNYSYPNTTRCHCLNNHLRTACNTPCHQTGCVFNICERFYF